MRSDRERLLDMIEAAHKITDRVQRGRHTFEVDEDVRLAMVHLLEIVGEAAAGLSAEFRTRHPDLPLPVVVGMRNRIIHGYFDIDHDVLWRAATEHLPPFAQRVEEILTEDM